MSSPMQYRNVDYQIEKLKTQNLTIKDEKTAKQLISTCGYSNLIKGYRAPYVFPFENSLRYRDGVTFEQIYSLYLLDKNLRSAVIASMLDLEEHIKALSAEVLAEQFGARTEDYLQFRNYSNKRKRKEQFTLKGILDKLNETLKTSRDPIHRCMEKHGDVPPWILFRGIYFSTMVNFIDQFKVKEQNILAHKLFDPSLTRLSDQQLRFLMMDSLFICMEMRNLAAHGGRIYNHTIESRFRKEEIFGIENTSEIEGFSLLLSILNSFYYKDPFNRLSIALNNELNRHCKAYPQDVTYLAEILKINIIEEPIDDTSSH